MLDKDGPHAKGWHAVGTHDHANPDHEMRQRDQAHQALRGSDRRPREFADLLPQTVFELDEAGNLTFLNSAGLIAFGYRTEDVEMGLSVFDLLLPEDRNRAAVQLRKLLSGEQALGVEYTALGADHKTFPAILYANPVIRDGEPVGAEGIILDNTDQKRADEELRRSERRFEDLALCSADFMWETNKDGEYVFASGRTEDVLGYQPHELIGKTPFDLMPEEEAARVQGILKEVTAAREPISDLENWKLTQEGQRVRLLTDAVPMLDADLKVVGYRGVDKDITKRKEAEEGLRQAVPELERSNAELQQFAYVASHDLQEPLRMVTSYLQLLERRYKGQLDDKADQWIEFAVDGAARMQRLISDLLTYSRVGTRGKEFHETDCNAVLDELLPNLQAAIEESGAVVTHDPLPTLLADASQFAQLLQNLISNAIKYRGDEPPQIHISAEQRDSEWLFSVRDNGIGIAPEHADRIFVIFQRLHGVGEYSGTGIGLAVCKKIVERHGGRIWVESEPGQGSTFHFTMPMMPVQPAGQGDPSALPRAS